MRRCARYVWPYLALVLGACSLVVDFPEQRVETDAGLDASEPQSDAGEQDAGTDATARTCDLRTHAGCQRDELCCPGPNGGAGRCEDATADSCAVCGDPCREESAPNCGDRVCECVPGSGVGCANGQHCVKDGTRFFCAQCEFDTDCTGENRACDKGTCVQCKSDANCPVQRPICNAGQCAGCTESPNNCPSGQLCNAGQGCFGCSLTASPGGNGCNTSTRPVCKAVDVLGTATPQCRGCNNDRECDTPAGSAYCDTRTGACTNVCKPGGTVGNNACTSGLFCKDTATGGYACQPCNASDCGGATPFCATEGAKVGACIGCRTNSDCASGTAPVCDTTERTCRARRATDCVAPLGQFDPVSTQCVECLTSAQCAGNAKGAICNLAGHVCGQCNTSADCTNPNAPTCSATGVCEKGCKGDADCTGRVGTPVCNTAAGTCVACNTNAQCTADPKAPLCGPANTCVGCSMVVGGAAAGDPACAMKTPAAPTCVTTGAQLGSCGVCDPTPGGRNVGCAVGQFCLYAGGATTASCNQCNPNPAPNGSCTAPAVCETTPTDPVFKCRTPTPTGDAGMMGPGPIVVPPRDGGMSADGGR